MMKNILSSILLIGSMLLLQPLAAQTSNQGQKEMQALLEQAKKQMSAEDYGAANRSFRKMLEMNRTLPTEMCYYFASTLYMIGQYENSLRFVEKYQALAGQGGEFSRESEELKGLLHKEMEKIRACKQCDLRGYELETCYQCLGKGALVQRCRKCFGRENIKCETCSGEGVVIEKDHFGQKKYHSCTVCEGKGVQLCPLCEGEGLLSSHCHGCGGSGQLPTEKLCSHPEPTQ